MKKRTIVIWCVVSVLACLATFALLRVKVKREFTARVYHGQDAVAFVLHHPTLAIQWQECGLSTNVGMLVEVTAAEGVLQSGSRFYVSVDVGHTMWLDLWDRLSLSNETLLQDSVLDLCITGKQFTVSPRVGYDGPDVRGIVNSNRVNRITYYGYGGDGG